MIFIKNIIVYFLIIHIEKIPKYCALKKILIDKINQEEFKVGEFISNTMAKVLKNCDDFSCYMEGMAKVKKMYSDTDFILIVYENTVEEIGDQKFIDFFRKWLP